MNPLQSVVGWALKTDCTGDGPVEMWLGVLSTWSDTDPMLNSVGRSSSSAGPTALLLPAVCVARSLCHGEGCHSVATAIDIPKNFGHSLDNRACPHHIFCGGGDMSDNQFSDV